MPLRITERAVSRIVAAAAASVPGVMELGRSLERPTGRTWPRYDVIVDDAAGTCSIEAFIAVVWPSPVTAVAEAVRTTIADWVRDSTGLTVTRVNVVVGPVVRGRAVTAELIDAHPTHPRLRPVTVRPTPLRPITVGRSRVR
ncbi:Asp23/Gls24 family envelope stress response protein [Corynebacterium sp. YIM 101645]|uniref:Asp23/Gls24 family envelope stress response protein n=1 Tax=Corynebacterium lemuris TaxID=1859292 RepID=A0ABT2FTA2_9CORY|nr:Asp23/Gls24 family envelope stress response protein [Corynebacterium lemuris]MCS5478455.1 Asp23/Gls24 family envelope stress response protein [Corynebacterium lemuris]